MKRNTIKIFLWGFLSVFLLASCESYLDKEEDLPMNFPKIWKKRSTIEQSLSNV